MTAVEDVASVEVAAHTAVNHVAADEATAGDERVQPVRPFARRAATSGGRGPSRLPSARPSAFADVACIGQSAGAENLAKIAND